MGGVVHISFTFGVFHESKLSVTDIIPYLEGVKKLLENAEKVFGS
jgi:hypothetical protein